MEIFRIRKPIKFDMPSVLDYIGFCLDRLEEAPDFNQGLSLHTEIVHSLSIEEVVCALVEAERYIINTEEFIKNWCQNNQD